MAYSNEQSKEHIREIQRYLYNISHFNSRIPKIHPDGIYGPQTAAAVGAFQREYDLPVTGETDDVTWNKIVDIFLNLNSGTVLLEVFTGDSELVPGDEGIAVYILQVILEALKRRFDNIPSVKINGVYDKDTQTAVDSFKDIAGLDSAHSGVDPETWNRLASGFNMMNHSER